MFYKLLIKIIILFIGFQNKNVRQLWLVLALVDPTYRITEKEKFKNELKSYTAPAYSFEIRETAFGYINELQLWEDLHSPPSSAQFPSE